MRWSFPIFPWQHHADALPVGAVPQRADATPPAADWGTGTRGQTLALPARRTSSAAVKSRCQPQPIGESPRRARSRTCTRPGRAGRPATGPACGAAGLPPAATTTAASSAVPAPAGAACRRDLAVAAARTARHAVLAGAGSSPLPAIGSGDRGITATRSDTPVERRGRSPACSGTSPGPRHLPWIAPTGRGVDLGGYGAAAVVGAPVQLPVGGLEHMLVVMGGELGPQEAGLARRWPRT